ncbi:LCP family protein [Phycicoccus sp. MAQZ13P-2]|uniref:LCP family protein n=1 Tax=Phycicoccus mangrovi TaxID=2840470 RepID=UPI001C003832|nr:LCP family protein [Phycicoccus mangrovi]MBT9255969.1 LCP family protein [Phycicoccus mangrovi]MBT9274563.1 LCP family protein [Phycicoccus mangrovi]
MSDDHARPIPRRPAPGSGDDDVYVVDTRRRRGAPSPGTARRSGGAPPAGVAADPVAYDEYGRPVPAGGGGGRTPGGRTSRPPREPRPPRAPRTRRPGRGRRIASLVVLLLVAWVGFTAFAPWHAWSSVSRVDDVPSGERPAAGDGHTYLLVGSDSREGLSREDRKKLGTGTAEGRRTDSIILVHTPSGSGKPALVSVPRDSFLPIPGHGENKVNAAFAIGGPKLLVRTLEQATGLRIDGYVEIGFGGFSTVVDSLGGVDLCVPRAIKDEKAHIDLAKGCQTLDGPTALGYVRARYSDPEGDIGRAKRQRQFLGAVMKEAATPSTVLVPWRWWSFTHAAASSVYVGQETSLLDAYRILSTMRKVSSDEALSLVVPIGNANVTTSAGSSVVWDAQRSKELFGMLRDGTPLEAPPPGTDGKPTGG